MSKGILKRWKAAQVHKCDTFENKPYEQVKFPLYT